MCRLDKTEIVLTGLFKSSSNQNYVGTKFSCLKYDLQCTYFEPDITYNTTMYVPSAKTQVSLCIDPQASCILYDQRRVWSECAVAVALFILLRTARLSKVNTISECSYQNVQLRRLTRVFAHRTRSCFTPSDHRRYIRLAKALIKLLMCSPSMQADPSLCTTFIVGFAMHRHMRNLFVQT